MFRHGESSDLFSDIIASVGCGHNEGVAPEFPFNIQICMNVSV